MPERQLSYQYERGARKIFDTLQDGHNEVIVKTRLKANARDLLRELAEYQNLLDPYRYSPTKAPKVPESAIIKAQKRIGMYKSPFKGWSMYEVDGVFFNRRGRTYDERVQVVRLMFRFKSRYTRQAKRDGWYDILRSIILFSMPHRGLLSTERIWDEASKKQFMAMHPNWSRQNKKFVEYFE